MGTIYLSTTFVDNTEEYDGLKNSGLIELIDNEEIIQLLQKKYTQHQYFKRLENSLLGMKQ